MGKGQTVRTGYWYPQLDSHFGLSRKAVRQLAWGQGKRKEPEKTLRGKESVSSGGIGTFLGPRAATRPILPSQE